MVKELRLFSRRQLMTAASLAASTAATASFSIAYASPLRPTPEQILGPFWPTQEKPDLSGDLTRVPGSTGRAMGQVLHVSGRVLNRDGMPVPNAKLDIWQANSFGRYRHPSDRNPAPLDPNFNGFAELASDADGSYRFVTIKPSPYPVAANIIRPAASLFPTPSRRSRRKARSSPWGLALGRERKAGAARTQSGDRVLFGEMVRHRGRDRRRGPFDHEGSPTSWV